MQLLFVILITFSATFQSSICQDEEDGLISSMIFQFESKDVEPIFDSYYHVTPLEDYPDVCSNFESESCAELWANEMDKVKKRNSNRMANINYRYATDINDHNAQFKYKFQKQSIAIYKKLKKKLNKFKWKTFKSPLIKRIFQILSPTIESNNDTISENLIQISLNIGRIYNSGQPCFGECLEEGEAGITNLFATERDYNKLAGFWSAWRNVTGSKIKDLLVERIRLQNIGARENGYDDSASFELKDDFEEDKFNETVIGLYEDILPLYEQLHGYVRYCLARFYPDRFDKNGPIPAHILGNVWAQQWNNILPILQVCRERVSDDSMQEEVNRNLQSLTVNKMFKLSEKFYTSIDMFKMTRYFWERSVVKQRPGKKMNCHGSAHNFANGVDYRIKMCTKKTINHFTTIHHEMGHIQYYMTYKQLPYAFFGAANPGFHEAVGDTIALAVKTPKHLQKIGLIDKVQTSEAADIDSLLTTALEKIAFLPFALTMDSYLWSLSNGSVPYHQLNKHWWDLRYRFQGLKPPNQRSENDFDAAAKYHLAFGRSYIRYFVSFILQFQFYEAMCSLSEHRGPLHQCDFYESKEAGRKLLEMLSKGKSQHWKDSLEILTGTRDISSKSIMKYFEPLFNWLKITNKKLGIPIGW